MDSLSVPVAVLSRMDGGGNLGGEVSRSPAGCCGRGPICASLLVCTAEELLLFLSAAGAERQRKLCLLAVLSGALLKLQGLRLEDLPTGLSGPGLLRIAPLSAQNTAVLEGCPHEGVGCRECCQEWPAR